MLRRIDIRRIFSENRGAAARVAKQLGIDQGSITRWLKGERPSERIEKACREEAERLLRGE